MPKTYYSLISKSNILILMIIVVCFLFIGAKSHAAAITYTYDSLNRLTRVVYGNGDTIEYTYDAAGNRLTLKASDTTPPDTSLSSQPSSPANSTSASFSFASTEAGSTFECQMDNGGYSACTSPRSYTLTDGGHTFCVKATDSAGNTDSAPECYLWTIDTINTGTTAPDITASPTTLPFGNVNVDSSSERSVSVRNDGNANLTIGTITNPSSPFSKVSDNCSDQTLSPSAGCTVTIKFSPKSTETFTSSVNIPSNEPDETPVTISLTGAGASAGSPDITVLPSLDLSFPNILVGVTADQTITVKNEGTSDLIISSITSPPAPFGIVAGVDNCSNRTLTPNQSCTIKLRFAPAESGIFGSSLIIPSNDPDENPVTVNLSGSATPGTNNLPTKPNLAEPANGATGMPTALTLKWEISTDADGDPVTYRLYIGTDPSLAEVSPITLASASDDNNSAMAMRYSIGIIGLLGMIAIGRLSSNRKKMGLFIIVIIMVTGFIFTFCGSSGGRDGNNNVSDNKNYESYTINLQPNTTYYWKIAADDGKGGVTESDTYSFRTRR